MADGTPIIIKKKKGHGGHGHHGGSWKVAYADFVTAMMAFFMVMWIMGLSDDKKTIVQGYFNDPIGFSKNEPRSQVTIQPPGTPTNPAQRMQAGSGGSGPSLQADKKAANELKEKIEEEVKKDGDIKLESLMKNLEMSVTSEGLQIELSEERGMVFFETGSARVRPEAARLLGKIGPILAMSHRKMVIQGHTDARPYPSTLYDNFDLSNDRAQAIRRALRVCGVSEKQILGICGYGSQRLKRPDQPYHFSNRRVTLLMPFKYNPEASFAMPGDSVREDTEAMFKVTHG